MYATESGGAMAAPAVPAPAGPRPKLAIRTELSPSYSTISTEALAEHLRAGAAAEPLVLVDVRGDDHKGGHIPGAEWVAFPSFEARAAELVAGWCAAAAGPNQEAPIKICFYCQYSSERGPSCALTAAAKVCSVHACPTPCLAKGWLVGLAGGPVLLCDAIFCCLFFLLLQWRLLRFAW